MIDHVVCLHEDRWQALMRQLTEMTDKVDRMHDRLFVDNGKPSIQTALIQGDSRFMRIEAHLATMASTMKHSSDTTTGIAVEAATIEGMIMQAMKGKLPVSSGTRAMWVSLAIIFPCAAYIFHCLKAMTTGG